MSCRVVTIAVTAALLAALAAPSAEAKQKNKPRVRHVAPIVVPSRAFEPARMIEVRPGVFISSYGCITDEGYGRWGTCDATNRSN